MPSPQPGVLARARLPGVVALLMLAVVCLSGAAPPCAVASSETPPEAGADELAECRRRLAELRQLHEAYERVMLNQLSRISARLSRAEAERDGLRGQLDETDAALGRERKALADAALALGREGAALAEAKLALGRAEKNLEEVKGQLLRQKEELAGTRKAKDDAQRRADVLRGERDAAVAAVPWWAALGIVGLVAAAVFLCLWLLGGRRGRVEDASLLERARQESEVVRAELARARGDSDAARKESAATRAELALVAEAAREEAARVKRLELALGCEQVEKGRAVAQGETLSRKVHRLRRKIAALKRLPVPQPPTEVKPPSRPSPPPAEVKPTPPPLPREACPVEKGRHSVEPPPTLWPTDYGLPDRGETCRLHRHGEVPVEVGFPGG